MLSTNETTDLAWVRLYKLDKTKDMIKTML